MYFPTKCLPPTPKITPKPHFGGPFNAKPIIQIALRKSHVKGATNVKLYTYIAYRYMQVLGVCRTFTLGVSGGAGRHNVSFDPLLARKLLQQES